MVNEKEKSSDSKERAELCFGQAMDHMDETINEFLNRLSHPGKESLGDVFQNGFSRKDPALALVLKLVQLVSNLRAGKLLVDQGYVYELGTIRRMVYETAEDVMFLLAQHHAENEDDLHQRFLESFYADGDRAVQHPKRYEIRDFLKKLEEKKETDHASSGPTWEKVIGRLYRVNSEYVHGRASRIRCLYDQQGNRFRTQGVDQEAYLAEEIKSFWLISFVAMYCFAAVRAAFRRENWQSDIWKFANAFYETAGLGSVSVGA